MKRFSIIICLFCFAFIGKAQVKETDASLNYLNESVVYIVDGYAVRKEAIKPEEVFSKDVLKGEQLSAIYSNKKLDTLTVIITKKGAIKYYQVKLSAFSREYESYLKSHNSDDSNIAYVVHGEPIESKGDELTSALYKIPQEKIISVTFTDNAGTGKKMAVIDIKVGE